MSINEVKTVLVSGASGFLGRELVRQLIESNNYHVIALTSKSEELINVFGELSNLLILNTSDWLKNIDKNSNIDVLINCAFPRSSDPGQLVKGLDFAERLIRDSLDLNIKEIINISSQSVYSQKEKSSTDEKSSVIPESLYGMAKYATEKIVATICEGSDKNVNYSNIRLASLTGIGLEVRMTNRFVKRALEGETITINGGSQKISYLDVRDASSALIAMINTDSSVWNPVYNLGNHYSCSILEVAETVKKIAEENLFNNVKIEVHEGKDNFSNLINSDLFYKDFNWKPYYTIPLMVKDLFEYYTVRV